MGQAFVRQPGHRRGVLAGPTELQQNEQHRGAMELDGLAVEVQHPLRAVRRSNSWPDAQFGGGSGATSVVYFRPLAEPAAALPPQAVDGQRNAVLDAWKPRVESGRAELS